MTDEAKNCGYSCPLCPRPWPFLAALFVTVAALSCVLTCLSYRAGVRSARGEDVPSNYDCPAAVRDKMAEYTNRCLGVAADPNPSACTLSALHLYCAPHR